VPSKESEELVARRPEEPKGMWPFRKPVVKEPRAGEPLRLGKEKVLLLEETEENLSIP